MKEIGQHIFNLADLSFDWLWETNEHDELTYFTHCPDDVPYLPRPNALGRSLRSFARYPDDPVLIEYLGKVAAREVFKDIRFEVTELGSDDVRHVAFSGKPVFIDGNFFGYRGGGRNVTEEVQYAKNFARIAEENRALVENSLDLIALINRDGLVLRINAAATDILGYRPEELVGKPYLGLVHPMICRKQKRSIRALNLGRIPGGTCKIAGSAKTVG